MMHPLHYSLYKSRSNHLYRSKDTFFLTVPLPGHHMLAARAPGTPGALLDVQSVAQAQDGLHMQLANA